MSLQLITKCACFDIWSSIICVVNAQNIQGEYYMKSPGKNFVAGEAHVKQDVLEFV